MHYFSVFFIFMLRTNILSQKPFFLIASVDKKKKPNVYVYILNPFEIRIY